MDISPMASMVAKAFSQSCTIEPWDPTAGPYANGYDANGQALYGTARTAACRIAEVQAAQLLKDGDLHGAWGTVIMLPADDPVSDKDRITLPEQPDAGAIIQRVVVGTDLQGRATHKEVYV